MNNNIRFIYFILNLILDSIYICLLCLCCCLGSWNPLIGDKFAHSGQNDPNKSFGPNIIPGFLWKTITP